MRPLPRRSNIHRYPILKWFSKFAYDRSYLWSFRSRTIVPALFWGVWIAMLPIVGVQMLVVFLHVGDLGGQVVVIHPCHLFKHLDLGVVVAIGLLKLITLLVQLVHVVEKLNVLFLSLDESSNDFVNIVDSSSLHDRLKGLLNDLSIPHILVKQALLLNVLVDDRVEADDQDLNRVGILLLPPWPCLVSIVRLRLLSLNSTF